MCLSDFAVVINNSEGVNSSFRIIFYILLYIGINNKGVYINNMDKYKYYIVKGINEFDKRKIIVFHVIANKIENTINIIKDKNPNIFIISINKINSVQPVKNDIIIKTELEYSEKIIDIENLNNIFIVFKSQDSIKSISVKNIFTLYDTIIRTKEIIEKGNNLIDNVEITDIILLKFK